jgi:hypothetical protein
MSGGAPKTLFVIGFGAVGQAWLRFVKHVAGKGLLQGVRKIRYFAPEITEFKDDGLFEFNNGPFVTRETLVPLLDKVRFFLCAGRAHFRASQFRILRPPSPHLP